MKLFAALAVLLCLVPASGYANMSRAKLDSLAADPQPGARLPLNSVLIDEHGTRRPLGDLLQNRPAMVVFADYTCRTLCGPILSFAANALAGSGLRPGLDYHLIVIGIDPRDGADAALAMKTSRVGRGTPLFDAIAALSGDEPTIKAISEAAGYRFVYDAEHDQFAHPAVAYAVSPDGRIVRTLSALGLDPTDVRLALVEAGQGRVGSFADSIHLLCYGFDPAKGIYTASIIGWLQLGGVLTVALLAFCIGVLIIRGRSQRWT